MIYGIGADVVEPGRIRRLLERYGDRLAQRVLGAEELEEYRASRRKDQFLANRYAAKEAFSKAIGTGVRYPVSLTRIRVTRDQLGKPGLSFDPVLAAFVRERGITGHHLTLTNESTVTVAVVVLER